MNRTPIGRVTTALLPADADPDPAPSKELPTLRSDSGSIGTTRLGRQLTLITTHWGIADSCFRSAGRFRELH